MGSIKNWAVRVEPEDVSVMQAEVEEQDGRMQLLGKRLEALEELISELSSEQQEHFDAQKKLLKVLSETKPMDIYHTVSTYSEKPLKLRMPCTDLTELNHAI